MRIALFLFSFLFLSSQRAETSTSYNGSDPGKLLFHCTLSYKKDFEQRSTAYLVLAEEAVEAEGHLASYLLKKNVLGRLDDKLVVPDYAEKTSYVALIECK